MKDDVQVSIYCLAYNHEKYIRKTLDGFVSQVTDFKYEIIVHDDASTDMTAAIIREYEAKYPDLFRPIYQTENQHSKGIEIGRTYIVPRAKGKYVAMCEGDDYWTDDHKLQKQYDALENNPNCSMSTHLVRCCNEDGTDNPRVIPSKQFRIKNTGIITKDVIKQLLWIRGSYPFHTSSYFVRKEVLLEPVNIKRDIAILRKALIHGDFYYFHEGMSVRRLNSIGNFNSVIRGQGIEGKVWLSLSNIECDRVFDKYTNYAYHKEISAFAFKSILEWSEYKPNEANAKMEELSLSYSKVRKELLYYQKIKYGWKYIKLKTKTGLTAGKNRDVKGTDDGERKK